MTGTWCQFTGIFLKAYAIDICAQADMQGDIDHTLHPQMKAILARRQTRTEPPPTLLPPPDNPSPTPTHNLPVQPPFEASLPVSTAAEVPNLNSFFPAPL
jgi:hypothetical protein